jgi:gliding motility-associated lipoprotein GldD
MYKVLCPLLALSFIACQPDAQPKPRGEFRLDYPQAKYQAYQNPIGFGFERSVYSKVEEDAQKHWFKVSYPNMKAKIYGTYLPVQGNLEALIKESEKMVYKHTIKASAIEAKAFEDKERQVSGKFYELQGQTASNIEFYITDGQKHFVTGSLYFKSRPKPDSLAPAIDYLKTDMRHLIDTFVWR